jgi:hypothetical protein
MRCPPKVDGQMTDARFPERWLTDRRLQRLSDSYFRSFITALAWSVTNRTDGVIVPEDLGLIPNFAAGAVKAFVAAGVWTPREKGWLIVDYAVTQTSREQLDAAEVARASAREKKARQRAAKRAAPQDVPPVVPGDVPGDNTGQDRQGEAPTQLAVVNGGWRGAGPDPFDEYK